MSQDQDPVAPPGIDPTKPSIARGYDYLLGGKDNYDVDRQAVQMLLAAAPDAPAMGRANRAFGERVVTHLARQGIRQFLDLGSGIPTTPPSVHEAVRAVHPDARVVYVDFDPIVVAHSAALRSTEPGLVTVLADVRDPDTVLHNPELTEIIDFDQPVGVLLFSVLHSIADDENPAAVVARFRDRLVPGSFLGISHFSTRSDPAVVAQIHAFNAKIGFPPIAFRGDAEVLRFFDGLDLVEPGLVEVDDWHPGWGRRPVSLKHVGALGRKSA